MEDDYRILRKYEGRSSLATFLTVVLSNLLFDRRSVERGRWRASAEAERLGETAVLLEKLTVRDGRSIDEALPIVRAADPAATRAGLERLAARLPEPQRRPRVVELDALPEVAVASPESADARVHDAEVRRTSERTAHVLRDGLAECSDEDRLLLRLRFGSSMSIADISRVLHVPQRPLYRQVERLLERLRRRLTAMGIRAASIEELIGARAFEHDLGLETRGTEPVHTEGRA
jgi:RNA polymerase sigma factor (sigma-70 family)